jgi:hypothetical protein
VEIDEELAAYRAALVRWGEIGVQDPETANTAAAVANQHANALAATRNGQNALKALLADEDPYVRVFTAFDCLRWWPDEARVVLEEAAATRDPGALEARLGLWAYQRGELPWQKT